MSQVIQKFEPGGKTTQPRLYKRGNEDINLDAFSNEATIELQRRLANSRLKDKEKSAVQAEFSRILEGMYDGTFTYRIGGGYNNSVGMANAKKGFDAAGIAAGILGDVLRSQSVYTAPEEKPDPSKITWSGNSSIGSAITRRLFGSDTANTKDFIGLDYDSTSKKVTGNKQRSSRFKSALEYVRDNFDNLFTSFTDADKASAIENINAALGAFADSSSLGSSLDDNEYLDLNRATGMSNLRELFGNTYELPTTPTTPGNPGGGAVGNTTYNSEDEWRAAVHPRSTKPLTFNRSLTSSAVYHRSDRDKLATALNSLTKDQLLKVIATGMTYSKTGQELNRLPQIIRAFGGAPRFENNFILRGAVELCRRKKYLHQFDANSNNYYIPFVSSKLDSKGTGIVYQISPDGNHTLIEMDRNDIPYFINAWHQEFIGQVPSNKKGGILKFQAGGNTPWYAGLTDYDSTKYTYAYNLENLVDGDMSDNEFSPWASATAGQQLGRYTPTTGHGEMGVNKAHFNFAQGVEGQQYYKNFGQALLNEDGTPTDVGIAWMKKVDSLLPADSPARFYDAQGNLRTSWTPTGNDAHGRAQRSYSSLADYIGAIRNDQILGARHNVFLNEGKRYFYKDADGQPHWVDPEQVGNYTVSDTPAESSGWNNDHTVYWNDYELTGPKTPEQVDPEQVTPEEEHSDAWRRVFGPNAGRFKLDERFLPLPDGSPKFGGFGNFLSELAPDLVGSSRLWASLHTNNRVYDTVLPSLKPVLKDTYERYSPVTGARSTWQFKNRQGFEALSQSYRPFTSDASLAAARMLEGQRQANQLQTEGFLADDQEIRRTKAEALARQEDNMARRSEVANFNRASINQTNRERAQLEATRLKSNWQSWDNFLAGLETRWRTRLDENRERANNFYDKLATSQAEDWYNQVMEPADRAYAAWQKDNVGADPSTEWGVNGADWTAYVNHKREARARANSMLYADMARRYNLSYSNPYTDKSNALFNWKRRYIPKGTGV